MDADVDYVRLEIRLTEPQKFLLQVFSHAIGSNVSSVLRTIIDESLESYVETALSNGVVRAERTQLLRRLLKMKEKEKEKK